MHEVSVCESIIDIVIEHASKESASRVTSIRLKIGEMAGVALDSMRFAFGIVAKGTLAEGAELIIDTIPLAARCRSCGRNFKITNYAFSCAHCNSPEIEVVSGRELCIEEIVMETI